MKLLKDNYKEMDDIVLRETIYVCIRLMWESKQEFKLNSFLIWLFNNNLISVIPNSKNDLQKDNILNYCSGMIYRCKNNN